MRKRIWAILLTVCLLVGLLPTTALAGGLDTAKTYDELVEKLASQTGTIYVQPSENFGWPENGELTIRANSTIKAVDDMDRETAWEIPEGITVNFEKNCRGIQCTKLTINGTMHTAYSSQDAVLRECDKVIIGPTGTFTCADDMAGRPTVCGVHIPEGQTWEVQQGGTLNCGVRLDGTLTGSGTVSGTVSAQGGFSGTASNGILSGNLTLTGSVQIGQWNSGTYADRLTIPAGSHIFFQPAQYGSIQINENAALILNGQLDISGSRSSRTNGISLRDTGELQMGAGSVLSLHYPYELSWSYDLEEGSKVPDPSAPLVTGSGTIEYYADNASRLLRYCLFYRDITGHDMPFETAYSGLVPTFMESSVTLWRSWTCDHIWDVGAETKAPTCTEPGERTYTCTKCQATKTEEIPATGHTEVIDEAVAATCTTEGKTQGSHCSVCGAVITAQETIPALGHDWSTDNCAEQATCSRCDAVRPAGQHIWGAWIVDQAATCTEEGSRSHTCTSCGHSESEGIPALGHDYQSAVTAPTCTEGGYTTHTCSRCGASYRDSETAALGHDWGEWVVTKEPTETQEGSQTRTCSRCGAEETHPIATLAKQDVGWTVDAVTWTYGDVISAQNTAYNDTEGGGALTYSSSDPAVATVDEDGKATIVGAGTATITATAAAVPGKYVETSASYTLTIHKAPLTITADDAAISYGQAPAGTGWTGSGYVYQEDASVVTGTPVYTSTYEQYGAVGTYALTVSGLSAKNYEITYAPGTLTVSEADDYTITLGKLEQLAGHTSPVSAQISPWDDTAVISVEYKVNGEWGSALPSEAGPYEVRAELTSSENITPKADTYTYGTLTIGSGSTVSVGDTTVSVGTTVTGDGKAEITVSDEQLHEILTHADGNVSMDLSGVKDTDQLVLPGSLISGLSKSEAAGSLTVATEDASVVLSAPVLDTVAATLTGDSDQIAVQLAAVEETDLSEAQQAALESISQEAVIVEVSLVVTHGDGSTTQLHQLGGDVKVKVPYAGAVPAGKYVVVCYLSDDSNVTYVRAAYDAETRQISFTTNHFSHYAVFVSSQPFVQVNGGSGSGTYAVNETVTIQADSKSGYRFDHWDVVSNNVTLTNANSSKITFLMPAGNVEITAVYDKVSSGGSGSGGSSAPTYRFDDVAENDYYYKAVLWAAGAGITSGTSATTFGPHVTVTRAQMMTFLWRANGAPKAAGSNPFTDVSTGDYYYDAVLWAVANGMTSGTSAARFSPDAAVTRSQAVTFLWRAAGSPAGSGSKFDDVAADAWYAHAVAWAVANGITSGTGSSSFSPEAAVSRAQAVTFLWRAMAD